MKQKIKKTSDKKINIIVEDQDDDLTTQTILTELDSDKFKVKDIWDGDDLIGCCWIDYGIRVAVLFHEDPKDDLRPEFLAYSEFLRSQYIDDTIFHCLEDHEDLFDKSTMARTQSEIDSYHRED